MKVLLPGVIGTGMPSMRLYFDSTLAQTPEVLRARESKALGISLVDAIARLG